METMNNELRLVLIGVTSYDIQGTANEIMGKTVFPDIRSTTEFHHSDLIEGYTGKRVHLTVAPGFMDNRASKSPWQMKRDIQYELQKIDYEKGFHGAIMVMCYPFRWTDEERDTVNYAVDVMKMSNLKHHGFLILTNGNNFKRKYPRETERCFREYLHAQGESEPELKKFLQMFNGRIFILDTELDDTEWNSVQVKRLFNGLQQVPGTFSLYASTLAVIYNHTYYLMSLIGYCLKTVYDYSPVPWLLSKLGYGSESDHTRKRKGRDESFDTLSDVEESKIVNQPKFESRCNVPEFVTDAMNE